MKRYVIIALTILGLAGCIVEFTPDIRSAAGDILVVEGTITDEETVISLSLSVDLATIDPESLPTPQRVVGALVWVESEAGGSFPAVEMLDSLLVWGNDGLSHYQYTPTGRYRALTGTLDDNTRYRVRIDTRGEEYVSGWRAPQSTPPIEEMEFHVEGTTVQVRVDVTGEADGPRNYMWDYQEVWETQAAVNASYYYANWEGEYLTNGYTYSMYDVIVSGRGGVQFRYPGPMSPFYYCWKHNGSKQLLIADTKRVSENRLVDHVLFDFTATDDRLSVLYHLKMNQYAIGDDAYEYLTTLRENTDNTGSIFSPVPSEMKGNLMCVTSPETYVIGFVEVSHAAVNEVFVNSSGSPYLPTPKNCNVVTMDDIMALNPPPADGSGTVVNMDFLADYYLVMGDESQGGNQIAASAFSTLRCIDCREGGGTKKRPNWWPNDHY